MRIIKAPLYTLQSYERGIKETLGKAGALVSPGSGGQIPFLQRVLVFDMREQKLEVAPFVGLSKDEVKFKIACAVYVRLKPDVESIKRAFYEVNDWEDAVIQLTMTSVQRRLSTLTKSEILAHADKISGGFLETFNQIVTSWGVQIARVEIISLADR